MCKRSQGRLLLLLAVLCISARSAYADIGMPMIMVLEPLFFILFLPIILVEAWVFKCHFPDASWKTLLKANFWSNFISTIAGIPFAWIISVCMMCLVNFVIPIHQGEGFWRYCLEVTLGAAWLVSEQPSYWTGPVAILVLLIPCFYISVWIEGKSIKNTLQQYGEEQLKVVTRKANIASYGLLYLVVLGYLIFNLWNH